MSLDRSYLLGGMRITVGASQVVGITSGPFNQGFVLKKVAGTTAILSIVDGPGMAWDTGYELGNTESISVSGPAQFYLAAAGATAVIQMSRTYSVGTPNTLPTLPIAAPTGLL